MKIQHKDVQILPVLQLHENIMTYISVLHKGATMEVCHSHVWYIHQIVENFDINNRLVNMQHYLQM